MAAGLSQISVATTWLHKPALRTVKWSRCNSHPGLLAFIINSQTINLWPFGRRPYFVTSQSICLYRTTYCNNSSNVHRPTNYGAFARFCLITHNPARLGEKMYWTSTCVLLFPVTFVRNAFRWHKYLAGTARNTRKNMYASVCILLDIPLRLQPKVEWVEISD
jgi:hypothetical protein